MIKTKNKWIIVLSAVVLLLLFAGFGVFREDKNVVSPNIETTGELAETHLGGVASIMPDNSAKIFFETLLGVKLSSYQSYDNIFETLSALQANEIQCAWFPDVTVDYLLRTKTGFSQIEMPKSTDARLEFAMALAKDNTALRDELNQALTTLKNDQTLDTLIAQYVTASTEPEAFYESDMTVKIQSTQRTIYVGVMGAVPPVDMIDFNFKPYGFSVALMDKIGSLLNADIRFVVLKNDTAFSALMGGKVDLIFCYGTSKNTMVTEKNYIMTDGYLPMYQYSYLVLE